MGKKPGTDTRVHPKKCLSGSSDGQGPWGGHQHGWISCPAYPTQVFKWVWAVSILLNALFGPGRTNGHTHKAKPIHPRYAGCNHAGFICGTYGCLYLFLQNQMFSFPIFQHAESLQRTHNVVCIDCRFLTQICPYNTNHRIIFKLPYRQFTWILSVNIWQMWKQSVALSVTSMKMATVKIMYY